MKKITLLLTIAAAGASFAIAQEPPPTEGGDRPKGERKRPSPEETFKRLDADSNGSLSLEEFKANPRAQKDPAGSEARFKEMDKDSNGSLSAEEFKAGRPPGGPGGGPEGRREGRGKGKGGPNGGEPAPAPQP